MLSQQTTHVNSARARRKKIVSQKLHEMRSTRISSYKLRLNTAPIFFYKAKVQIFMFLEMNVEDFHMSIVLSVDERKLLS